MARISRSTRKNNIVIVCEGEDTEPAYLEDLKRYVKGRFDDIRIVPFGSEAKDAAARDVALKSRVKNNSRKSRTTNAPKSTKSGHFYWVKEEEDEETYEKYRAQPSRYVREAQLFLEDGYVEAWAVYDYDKFPDHENARILADSDPRLNIAFSSVSFEEWLLLHFERNEKAFLKSCCKKAKKDIGCGDHFTHDKNDCHGEICVAGYLRENNLIPYFTKSKRDLFSSYTKPRLNLARVNASWVRSIDSGKRVFERNPYTDFDGLVARMFGLNDHYVWIGDAEGFTFDRCSVKITRNSEIAEITLSNVSDRTFIANWISLDDMANPISDPNRIMLSAGESLTIYHKGSAYVEIEYGNEKLIIIP